MSKIKKTTACGTLRGFVNSENEFHTSTRTADDAAVIGGRVVELNGVGMMVPGDKITLHRQRKTKGYTTWTVAKITVG